MSKTQFGCCNCDNKAQLQEESGEKRYFCSSFCQFVKKGDIDMELTLTQTKNGITENLPQSNINAEINIINNKEAEIFNSKLYDIFNGPRIQQERSRLTPEIYGEYEYSKEKFWLGDFRDLLTNGILPEGENLEPITEYKIAYEVWAPKGMMDSPDIVTVVLTHGVPVNRKEWYPVARLLARFVRVIMVDLLGMGNSTKLIKFNFWSWKLHANIFAKMLSDIMSDNWGTWFTTHKKIFFGANDWGSGVLQKFIELHGNIFLYGAIPCSAIALDGYWVQHIGSLHALTVLPYPSPTFSAEAIRFIGTYTGLLETMFHRTSEIHNQYTMMLFQETYVENSYSDPKKNPKNTEYKAFAVRSLAEQASNILGNGELLPYHSEKNQNGMDFSKWNVPILMLWGKNDKMMPEGQVYRFSNIVHKVNEWRKENDEESNLSLWYQVIDEAGHFAVSDQPERSADAILQFMHSVKKIDSKSFAKSFLGFDSLARQDEKQVIKDLKEMDNHEDLFLADSLFNYKK